MWIVDPPPFDGTNAPPEFTGRGELVDNGDGTATYEDDGGVSVEFRERPPDHQFPPCA